MIVVSDTSSLLALTKIQMPHLLPSLFGKVLIPPAVAEELKKSHLSKQEIELVFAAEWLTIAAPVNKSDVIKLLTDLDKGESEAIVLATEMNADYLLVDEKSARKIAKERGLKIMGVLGILSRAKEKHLVSELKPLLNKLISDAEFWIDDTLYQRILKNVNEL